MERLEHRDLVTAGTKLVGAGKSRGTGADDGHSLTGRGWDDRSTVQLVLPLVVRHKPFQVADAHRIILLAYNTHRFALLILGTHPAACGGEEVGLSNLPGRAADIPLLNQFDEGRDVNAHGARRYAFWLLTLNASYGLVHGLLS